MMAVDLLHVTVHFIVPSGVSFCWTSPCRRVCSAGASAPHFALPSARPSNVQASCLERCRHEAVAGSDSERQRRKARQKDAAPDRVESRSAHGGGAARRGFAAVPLVARGPRQDKAARVPRTPGHAAAFRERSHERPPRRRFPRAS